MILERSTCAPVLFHDINPSLDPIKILRWMPLLLPLLIRLCSYSDDGFREREREREREMHPCVQSMNTRITEPFLAVTLDQIKAVCLQQLQRQQSCYAICSTNYAIYSTMSTLMSRDSVWLLAPLPLINSQASKRRNKKNGPWMIYNSGSMYCSVIP